LLTALLWRERAIEQDVGPSGALNRIGSAPVKAKIMGEEIMDWLSSGGEVFHRTCTGPVVWTSARELAGRCAGCGAEIPQRVLQSARDQIRARASSPRPGSNEQARSARKILEELRARTEATMKRTSHTKE
jgi:hypothetical protein